VFTAVGEQNAVVLRQSLDNAEIEKRAADVGGRMSADDLRVLFILHAESVKRVFAMISRRLFARALPAMGKPERAKA